MDEKARALDRGDNGREREYENVHISAQQRRELEALRLQVSDDLLVIIGLKSLFFL